MLRQVSRILLTCNESGGENGLPQLSLSIPYQRCCLGLLEGYQGTQDAA